MDKETKYDSKYCSKCKMRYKDMEIKKCPQCNGKVALYKGQCMREPFFEDRTERLEIAMFGLIFFTAMFFMVFIALEDQSDDNNQKIREVANFIIDSGLCEFAYEDLESNIDCDYLFKVKERYDTS